MVLKDSDNNEVSEHDGFEQRFLKQQSFFKELTTMTFNRLLAITGLVALFTSPVYAANSFCIAVNGGSDKGGSTFVTHGFVVPTANQCAPWNGYAKNGNVFFITTGTACMTSDGDVLEFSLSLADPDYLGAGNSVGDFIRLCPTGSKQCIIGGGQSRGQFVGSATEQNCPQDVLVLPTLHN